MRYNENDEESKNVEDRRGQGGGGMFRFPGFPSGAEGGLSGMEEHPCSRSSKTKRGPSAVRAGHLEPVVALDQHGSCIGRDRPACAGSSEVIRLVQRSASHQGYPRQPIEILEAPARGVIDHQAHGRCGDGIALHRGHARQQQAFACAGEVQ